MFSKVSKAIESVEPTAIVLSFLCIYGISYYYSDFLEATGTASALTCIILIGVTQKFLLGKVLEMVWSVLVTAFNWIKKSLLK